MGQWEKYDVDMLLDIADYLDAHAAEAREWYCEKMFEAKDGWKISIFYDCTGASSVRCRRRMPSFKAFLCEMEKARDAHQRADP